MMVENMEQVQQEQEKDAFVVDSMEKADWVLGKIAKCRARMQENEVYAKKQIEKFTTWLEEVNAMENESISYFEIVLQPYLESAIAGTKKKSVKLPNGTIGFRRSTNFVKDDNALLDYLKGNAPAYVKVKESVDWANFKKTCKVDGNKLVTEDGEIVPAVTVEEVNTIYTKINEELE